MDECPICFEELSNTTTRVTTSCCNNTLHLGCLNNCKYKCPFCREYISIEVVDDRAPLIVPPTRSSMTCHISVKIIFGCFVILGSMYYSALLFAGFPPHEPLPPPPPPEIPPWPGLG